MKTLLIFLCTIFISFNLQAQEWTTEQKEVWKNVETYWDLLASGDIDGFLGYFHDDFSGWRNDSPLPDDKNTRAKAIKFFMSDTESLFYNIKPVAIKIHGDVAFVHYYYVDLSRVGEEEEMVAGRWTDVLLKQGDKWVMIGDHGGADPVDD